MGLSLNFVSGDSEATGEFSENNTCDVSGYLGGALYYPYYCSYSFGFDLTASPDDMKIAADKSNKENTWFEYYPDGKVKRKITFTAF